ncbi:MAG: MFS transporter [Steroidobacteraceae bacterium]
MKEAVPPIAEWESDSRLVTAAPHAVLLTALAYLPCLLGMMAIGIIVPFIDPLSDTMAVTRADIGFTIAVFSMPTAVLATAGGGLADRYGVRRCLIAAALLAAVGSFLASRAQSIWRLDIAIATAGLGFGGAAVNGPALLMRSLSGPVRTRAMSFLSTYPPTGYAAGLLLAVPFTAVGGWRSALQIQSALFVALALLLFWLLPRRVAGSAETQRQSLRDSVTGTLRVLREPKVLRLAVTIALINAVAYGTSLAIPSYLAHVQHLTIATSSTAVASAKIAAMVIGGLSMGYLLSRSVSVIAMFGTMAVIGLAAQAALFLPAHGLMLATAALIVWLFAFGGMSGGAMSLLPIVVSEPGRSGAASGVVNQFISVVSFAAPSIWLAIKSGPQFVLLAGGCLLVSLLALPWRSGSPGRPAS